MTDKTDTSATEPVLTDKEIAAHQQPVEAAKGSEGLTEPVVDKLVRVTHSDTYADVKAPLNTAQQMDEIRRNREGA